MIQNTSFLSSIFKDIDKLAKELGTGKGLIIQTLIPHLNYKKMNEITPISKKTYKKWKKVKENNGMATKINKGKKKKV